MVGIEAAREKVFMLLGEVVDTKSTSLLLVWISCGPLTGGRVVLL